MLITLSLSHQLSLESPSSSSGADETARVDLLPPTGHVQLLQLLHGYIILYILEYRFYYTICLCFNYYHTIY